MILVGDDPASAVYVRNKVKACADTGIRSIFEKYEATLPEADLLERISALNADPTVHGILVQMPLPKHIDPHRVIETISIMAWKSTAFGSEVLMTYQPGGCPPARHAPPRSDS